MADTAIFSIRSSADELDGDTDQAKAASLVQLVLDLARDIDAITVTTPDGTQIDVTYEDL